MEEQISVTDERERRHRRLALELGDALKWDVPVNVIHRTAQGILGITDVNEYDVESITSARAQTAYNWVMTLLQAPMEAEEADRRLREFICELLPAESEERARILRLLQASPSAPRPPLLWTSRISTPESGKLPKPSTATDTMTKQFSALSKRLRTWSKRKPGWQTTLAKLLCLRLSMRMPHY